MDLVDWDEGEFDCIVKELAEYVEALPTPVPVVAFPISALLGDNVVDGSRTRRGTTARAAGLAGDVRRRPGVVEIASPSRRAAGDPPAGLRLPRLRRPAGRRPLRVGDAVTVLPSGRRSTVSAMQRFGRDVDVRRPPARRSRSRWPTRRRRPRRRPRRWARRRRRSRSSGHMCWMIDQPLQPGPLVVQARHPRRSGDRRRDRVPPRPRHARTATTPS